MVLRRQAPEAPLELVALDDGDGGIRLSRPVGRQDPAVEGGDGEILAEAADGDCLAFAAAVAAHGDAGNVGERLGDVAVGELAEFLGASIGTTRPVVDDGVIPKTRMIKEIWKYVA